MSGSIVREFLVGLGFKIDQSSQRQFVDGVNNATGVVKGLKTAIEGLAVGAAAYGAVTWLDKMTGGMDKLYYAAQRAGSHVGKLQAFMYAASQGGSTPEQASSTAQSFYQMLRNNPNNIQLLQNNLGINARNPDGSLRDGASVLESVGRKLSTLDPRMQNLYSDQFGIPLELRQALMQGTAFSGHEAEFTAKQRAAGLDPEKAAENSKKFQQAVRSFAASFAIVSDKIGSALIGPNGIGKSMQRLADMLSARAPQIAAIMKTFVDAAAPVIASFIDWLSKLSKSDIIDGLKAFGIALVALVALKLGGMVANIVLLATKMPLLSIALVAAVAALNAYRVYQDFQDSKAPGDQGPADPISHFFKKDQLWTDALEEASKTPNITTARAKYKAFMDEDARLDRLPKNEMGLPVDMSVTAHRKMPARSAPVAGDAQSYLRALEQTFGLPAGLLGGVMRQESGGHLHALSAKGALGPFQFMPGTAARFGVTDPTNFKQSATGAAKYFAFLMKHYGGNLDMALAAYNWGEGNLDRFGMGRAPKETRDYVPRVKGMMGNPYRGERGGKGTAETGNAGGVNVKSETTIHVNGAGDPLAVGHAVSSRQDATNQRLARNFRPMWA